MRVEYRHNVTQSRGLLSTRHRESAVLDRGATGSSVIRARGSTRPIGPATRPVEPASDLIRDRDPSPPTIGATYLSSIFRPKSPLRLASVPPPPRFHYAAGACVPCQRPTDRSIYFRFISAQLVAARILHYIKPISRALYVTRIPSRAGPHRLIPH